MQIQEALGNEVPDLARASCKVFLLVKVKDSQCCRTGYRVAAIGTAKRSGRWRIHDFSTSNHTADGHACAHRLGDDQQVGFNAIVVDCKHSTGTTETRLNLVGDEENVVLFTDRFERS